MKVLYLTTSLAYGGAETQLVQVAKRLKQRGHEVRLVSMLPPQAYSEDLEGAGISVAHLGMCRGVPDPRAFFRLARLLRKWRPQVLHAHMVHSNLLARLVRLFVAVPVVICTAHSTYEAPVSARILREVTWRELAYRLTDFLCDLTTQISRAGLERYIRLRAISEQKARLVYNGIDTQQFFPDLDQRLKMRAELGIEEDQFVWLSVGRLEEPKDYPNLLNAFARLRAPDAVLLIVGQGRLQEDLKTLAWQLGIAERVSFLGLRQDIPQIMNAADAFALSSFYEGLGIVLLEASATRLPIIATDSGGPKEVVRDGETGFLVPPSDSKALADAMRRLMMLSPERRLEMGEAGRCWVSEQFGLEKVVQIWEGLYQELLARKGMMR